MGLKYQQNSTSSVDYTPEAADKSGGHMNTVSSRLSAVLY